ncbi:hypothetical protein KJK29_03665 [Streptomyces koelreuteriae]|uniref:Uncharacterized protein n=1 Tax=Streptomyces koelreuteriae TaxID=2838015 RepID=A0ABX8FKT2_9ACTN|nr:hypothetical protein KJK29_03665 [Streptomyces koelreuteriae]
MAAAPHPETELFTESHWFPEGHGRITELCQGAFVGVPALRSVAHYSNGIIDFLVRRTDCAPLAGLVTVAGEDIANEALPGSRLLLCTQDLGALMRPLGTGELMRVVVAGARGGLWGGRVKPGEYLAALTDTPGGMPAADEAMNTLVSTIRTQVHHLPDELPGGLTDPPDPLPEHKGKLRIDFGTAAAAYENLTEMRLRALWGGHVNTLDLHYAAFYQDWKLVCAGDVFENAELGPRFLETSVRSRRTGYRDLAQSLRGHLARLTDALRLVVQPPADRLVLDVQEGAVYVIWLSPRDYVLGVTLDQRQVAHAESRLHRLADVLREITEPAPR